MIQFENKIYVGSNGRESLYDCVLKLKNKGVIIFVHGYKGYKDWGAWNLVQKYFIENDFGFVKFNISHNGGTVEEPIDFPDLDAFGRNCYSYELNDLKIIIDEIERMISEEMEAEIPIYLMGHSRGGGICVLAASESDKIKKVVSLAGICDVERRFPRGDELEQWRNDGVNYVTNARTNQEMPHYFSFYEDFDQNRDKLDIEKACGQLSCDFLQVHGDMDVSVSITEGIQLAEWTNTELCIIKGAEHTFGSSQPWDSDKLPEDLQNALNRIKDFLEK